MCFSAEASFTAGAVLLPAGFYCVRTALRKDTRYVPLALVPIAFAIQQFTEGLVWLGLEHEQSALVERASVFYLFFAISFWPLWIPLSLALPATERSARALLYFVLLLSVAWFWLYYPIALDPQRWLAVEIVHHSIRYNVGELPAFGVLPRPAWRLAYLAAICVPLMLGRWGGEANRLGNVLGGGLVAGLFAISYLVFWYAFTSVWCFFAALLSGLLCLVFMKLPVRSADRFDANSVSGRRASDANAVARATGL